ncbi:MAG: flagellar filament capping protein FliD [Oscillospiraceae bacterium]|nr:flagellar filament capping protein FliD [Oscillospiraceae bacterium]
MSDSSSGLSSTNSGGRTMFSGLMSGLDTESLVKAATANLKTSINTKKQSLQKLTWKQDAYRDVISKLSDFQSKYLDILSTTSIRANAVMNKYVAESTNDKLQVTAKSGATPATYDITYSQKAAAAELKGTKASEGSIYLDFSAADAGSHTVEITLDGSTKKVTFNGGDNAKQNFLDAVNSTFKDFTSTRFAFKDDESNTDTTGKLILNTVPGDKVSHSFEAGYSSAIGLKNNGYSRISTNAVLGDIDFSTALDGDKFEFTINGVDFSFSSESKISDIINTVNKSSAGVTMSFSTLSQSFTLSSSSTGAGQSVEILQTKGNLINSLFNVSDGSETGGISWGSSVSKAFTEQIPNGMGFSSVFAGEDGFSADKTMYMTVNGYDLKLDLSALTARQETEKITVNIGGEDKTIDAKVSKTADTKEKIYSYTDENGDTYFIGKDKKVAFSVDSDGKTVRDAGGNVIDDETQYKDIMADSGFTNSTKVMHEFTADEYADAYNEALNKAVASNEKLNSEVTLEIAVKNGYKAETDGTVDEYLANMSDVDREVFQLQKAQRLDETALDRWGLKFISKEVTDAENNTNAYVDLNTGANASVYIKRASDFGFTPEKNYTEKAVDDSYVISDKALTFLNADGRKLTVTGTGANGEVTVADLTSVTDANGNAVFKFDENDGTITIAEGNTLTFADSDTRTFLNDVFGKTTVKGVSSDSALTVYGTNAQVTINGVTLESADSTFTVDGTTFTFNNVADFDAELEPDSAITVTTKKDNSAIMETVKSFINDYNTLIKDLYKQVQTARPKDGSSYYDPLTEEQEEEMSDTEIEKWNEKAKEGWLYNDVTVNRLINKVRGAMSTSFNGMSLYDLGITLKKGDYTNPTYEIDDSKLEAAINRYGDDVTKFFTDSENGLANNLNNAIDAAISTKSTDGAGNKKGYGYLTALVGVKDTVSETRNQYYTQMQSVQKVIDTLQERYEDEQERYWSRFTTLETYISKMSMQMSYFTSY